MDPHQDLVRCCTICFIAILAVNMFIQWSRFSGGDGAPFWTLAACGLEPRNFSKTQATFIHCEYPSSDDPNPSAFPAMIWATNYFRLAVFTVFTIFFGGRDFAPKCIIDGVNIQDYLTSHYLTAIGHLADRIRDAGDILDECVLGWDSLNEPSSGFLGHENLNEFLTDQEMKKGTRPTPAQCLRLGMGIKQDDIEVWGFTAFGPQKQGTVTVDPEGVKAWMDPAEEVDGVNPRWGWRRDPGWKLGTCIWALHDVWDPESGYILIPDYFRSTPSSSLLYSTPSAPSSALRLQNTASFTSFSSTDPERSRPPTNFLEDYWRPHWRLYAARIRKSHPDAILFVQPPVFTIPPHLTYAELQGRACYSPHYYDGLTLVTRHWNWFNADSMGVLRHKYKSIIFAIKIGERAIRSSIQSQLGIFPSDAITAFGTEPQYPTLLGEIGTPFDMDEKRSYGWTDDGKYAGDYTQQQKALDASLNGADGPNALNYTIWTYTADNSHEWGDGWNLEDLSLWSKDGMTGDGSEGFDGYRSRMEIGRMVAPSIGKRETGLGQFDPANDRSNTRLLLTRERTQEADGQSQFRPSTSASVADLATSRASMNYPTAAASATTLADDVFADGHDERGSKLNVNAHSDSPPPAYPDYASGAFAETLYHFLTNGARAVGAFVRPFPIAVVGTSTNIAFDIAKAEFKLTIKVTDADIRRATVAARSNSHTSSDYRQPGEEPHHSEKEEILPTEIYVPLIHFARDPFARRIRPSVSSSGASIMSVDAVSAAKGRGDSSQPAWSTWAGLDDPLTLEVEASEGSRWEVEGQVFKWWYAGPSFSCSRPLSANTEKVAADGSVERWITIRRRGGAIKGIGTRQISISESKSLSDYCPWKWF
jgi:hypothetical protein